MRYNSAMIAVVALTLALTPFSGPVALTSAPSSAKFSVAIRGSAGQHIRLRTIGVPPGYIASFCTDRVCAPFRVTLALPASGRASIELQLIENTPGARKPRTVTVAADGARSASIAFNRAVY
jgi:hypothetical protein